MGWAAWSFARSQEQAEKLAFRAEGGGRDSVSV